MTWTCLDIVSSIVYGSSKDLNVGVYCLILVYHGYDSGTGIIPKHQSNQMRGMHWCRCTTSWFGARSPDWYQPRLQLHPGLQEAMPKPKRRREEEQGIEERPFVLRIHDRKALRLNTPGSCHSFCRVYYRVQVMPNGASKLIEVLGSLAHPFRTSKGLFTRPPLLL